MKTSVLRRIPLVLASFAMAASICAGIARAQTPLRYEPPTVISTAEALYPINSVASGTVVLEVHLDKSGSIDSVEVLHDIPSLTGPAITAVKKWRFGAAKLDGHGIASVIPVAFTFVPPNVGPRI